MTSPDSATTLAERLAREGLVAVLGPDSVRPLRGDSPLPLSDADLVALADAVAQAAARAGVTCVLEDADLAPVAQGSEPPTPPPTPDRLAAAIDARLGQGPR